jgi:ABC-type hemin transport system substrate-binding protein
MIDFLLNEQQTRQTRVKLIKKEDLMARKESQKASRFVSSIGGAPAAAEGSRTIAPHLIGNPAAGGAAALPPEALANAMPTAAIIKGDPKVQLVEVEHGIYDIHLTCAAGELYIIRVESLEKAAQAPTT